MLDGVLHYRLKRQRRHAKRRVRRIKVDKRSIFKLCLLDCEICAGVLQLVAERYHILTGDRGEILSQVKRKVKSDLLCLGGILIAKVVDTHHSIAYEVRTHLEHHNAAALMCDLTLLMYILFLVVQEDQTEHYYGEERHAENNKYFD